MLSSGLCCVLTDRSLWVGISVNYNTPLLWGRGKIQRGLTLELYIFRVLQESAIKTDALMNSCHRANILEDQCFSLLWHQECSVHKSSETSIKRQPAVVMRNDEYSLTSEVKCVFIILNYLHCLLFCGGTYSTFSVLHHLSCVSINYHK